MRIRGRNFGKMREYRDMQKPEWMRVKPPMPDPTDHTDYGRTRAAEYMLSPMVTDEELAHFQRESMAIRNSICQIVCQFCATPYPYERFADNEHPIYQEELDQIVKDQMFGHDCVWAICGREGHVWRESKCERCGAVSPDELD